MSTRPDMERSQADMMDKHLRELVKHEQMRQWREAHADFIAAYNATINQEGLPLDQWKSF